MGSSTVRTWPSNEVDCPLCKMKYVLIKVADYSWIREKLYPSDESLETLKSIYRTSSMKTLLSSCPAITRVGKARLHIVFNLHGVRAFMDCWDIGSVLFGITVQRVT
jgi:hypothetical protein